LSLSLSRESRRKARALGDWMTIAGLCNTGWQNTRWHLMTRSPLQTCRPQTASVGPVRLPWGKY
jgi:hypothetical protein